MAGHGKKINNLNTLFFGGVAYQSCANGYRVHPMRLNNKGIYEKGWQKVNADKNQIDNWIAEGQGDSGMAILTGNVVGIDLDTRDARLTDEMVAKTCEILAISASEIPQRQGQKPKLMLIARAESDTPIRSVKSGKWQCWAGDEHQVEIKGQGALIVAYNIHPETLQPYTWCNGSPVDTPVSELPVVSTAQIDALIAYFDSFCEGEGMTPVSSRSSTGTRRFADNDFLNYLKTPDPNVTDAMVDEALAVLAGDGWAEDRDRWLTVGFALYHQYQGDSVGYEKWEALSQLSAKHVPGECEKRWDSGDLKPRDGTNAVTIGTVMHEARRIKGSAIVDASQAAEKQAQLDEVIRSIKNAENEQDVFDVGGRIAKFYVESTAAIKAKIRSALVDRLKYFKITQPAAIVGQMLRVTRRDHIAELQETHRHTREQMGKMFPFTKALFFSIEEGAIVHRLKGVLKNNDSINVAVGRDFQRIIEEQNVKPENHGYFNTTVDREEMRRFRDAKEFLLHVFQIPEVVGEVYYPGAGDFVELEDHLSYINRFQDWRDLPQTPEPEWSNAQRDLVDKVKHLIYWHSGGRGEVDESNQDYQILMSWLAHKFQHPEQKMQWAIYLTGPQGTGKSTMIDILRAVMGESLASERNVSVISRDVIIKSFTGWAAKGAIAVIDEMEAGRLSPLKRDEFLVRVRPHVASSRVDRERKGEDGVSVPNFQDYMFFANSIDGMVINAADRRFTAFKSGFLSKKEAEKTLVDTDFISDLLAGLRDRNVVCALRHMFLQYPVSSAFNFAKAYLSKATREVIDASLGGVEQALEALRQTEGTYYFTEEYVIIKSVRQRIVEIGHNVQRGNYDPNIDLIDDLKTKNNVNIIRKVLQEPPFSMGIDESHKFTYYASRIQYTVYTRGLWSDQCKQRFIANHSLVVEAESRRNTTSGNGFPLSLELDLYKASLGDVKKTVSNDRAVLEGSIKDEWD